MEEESITLSKEDNSSNILAYFIIIFIFINYYCWLFIYYKLCNKYDNMNICTKFVNGFNNFPALIFPQILITILIIYFGSNYLGWISIILFISFIISFLYNPLLPLTTFGQIIHLFVYFGKLY